MTDMLAVLDKGASILPAGIIEVEGTFGPGDTISIYHNHKEIGRGLINYSIDDMKAIKGHNTNDIAEILGINTTYDEAVHRNNLVLLHSGNPMNQYEEICKDMGQR